MTPPVVLDDTNFRAALGLYKTNESDATALYGDIAQWDVSRVKNMGELDLGADFLADLSAWNVSGVTNMAEVGTSSLFAPIDCWYQLQCYYQKSNRFIVERERVRVALPHL